MPNLGGDEDEYKYKVTCSAILRILQGVAVATKTSEEASKPVLLWIDSHRITSIGNSLDHYCHDDVANAPSFGDWHASIELDLPEQNGDARQLAKVALSIAFVHEKCRQGQNITPAGLDLVWALVHDALASPLFNPTLFRASRSSQGFLAIPLCSLIKDGNINELFRLHVWIPDGQRGYPDVAIHSHQPFAQSWILAGEGTDHSYTVEPEVKPELATHAEYALFWADGKEMDGTYKTHQTSSKIVNTGNLMKARQTGSALHSRDSSYCIPKAAFHRSEVAPDILHATLLFFDSHRGFQKDATILGPKSADSFIHSRDPGHIAPAALANMVQVVRLWEIFMEQGKLHSQHAAWEHALQAFNSALDLCESVVLFPNATRYKHLVFGELGRINRRFGRYEQAKDILENAIGEMGPSL